jgi:hypothetical protein
VLTVGEVQNPRASTLVERNAAGSWTRENSANVGSGDNHLYAVSSLTGGLAWAVGTYFDPSSGNLLTLAERRDGGNWVREPAPSPGQANGNSQLAGVLALSPSKVWAVGDYDGPQALRTLILRRCQ